MLDEKMKIRCDQLFNLGLKFNGEYYQDDRIHTAVHHTDILCEPDDKWEKIIIDIQKLRRAHSNTPLTDNEKEIAYNALLLLLDKEELPFDEFSKTSDLKNRLNPKYWKEEQKA